MKVRRAEKQDLPAICHMIGTRMIDSVEASYQLEGVSDKANAAQCFMASQLAYWLQIGEIWVIGDNQGILAGNYKQASKPLASLVMYFKVLRTLWKKLTKADRTQVMNNLKKSSGAQNLRWRKEACGSSDYYYINLIAIDHSLKGTGAFRSLMEPILLRASEENIPVLLDTHDKDNVPIYQHFGFELYAKYPAKQDHSIVQYAMIRLPESK